MTSDEEGSNLWKTSKNRYGIRKSLVRVQPLRGLHPGALLREWLLELKVMGRSLGAVDWYEQKMDWYRGSGGVENLEQLDSRRLHLCIDLARLMPPSRTRTSLLEEVAEPFADLPPLAGLIAAVLMAVLGWVAPLFAGASVIAGISLQFGRWLVWVLAALVLAYTLVGVGRRFIHRRTFDATDDPAGLTWSQFERLMAEFYRRKGATVTPRGGPIADGGVDLSLTYPSGERLIVQCKHWTNRQVGVKPVRELWGVLDDEKADGAIFVTSGSFSADALAFANGKQLELIDGSKLRGLLAELKRAQSTGAVTEPAQSTNKPQCPRCGSPMVLRTARRGANAGEQFWGCSTYPKCQGTQPRRARV